MFRKKQPSFNQFVDSLDDLEMLSKYSGRLQTLVGVTIESLTFLPYQTLKHTVPDLIKQLKFENAIFEIINARDKTVTLKQIERESNAQKLRFFFWVQDEYEKINKLEETYLTTPPDQKLVNAGIRELDVLGDVNLIDMLAAGDILKWQEIRSLPYEMIFDKQYKLVVEYKVNKKLAENKKP